MYGSFEFLVWFYRIGYFNVFWVVCFKVKVVFVEIWGIEKLLSSVDGVVVFFLFESMLGIFLMFYIYFVVWG